MKDYKGISDLTITDWIGVWALLLVMGVALIAGAS